MATYLTIADLVNFLRGRKADDCQIAADWVEEHPEAVCVQQELNRLESFAISLGMEARSWVSWLEACRAGLVHPAYRRYLAGLALFAERYRGLPMGGRRQSWELVLTRAQGIYQRRSPAWAAVISRHLRRGAGHTP